MVFFPGVDGFDQLAVAIVAMDDMVAEQAFDGTGGVQAATVLEITEVEFHLAVIEYFYFNPAHPKMLSLLH